LKAAVGEADILTGYEEDYSVNGENIEVARKAVIGLFKGN
jgi:hypothetical protein